MAFHTPDFHGKMSLSAPVGEKRAAGSGARRISGCYQIDLNREQHYEYNSVNHHQMGNFP